MLQVLLNLSNVLCMPRIGYWTRFNMNLVYPEAQIWISDCVILSCRRPYKYSESNAPRLPELEGHRNLYHASTFSHNAVMERLRRTDPGQLY